MTKNICWTHCGFILVGLFEAPNTLTYVGSHPHGQKWVCKENPHWKSIETHAWSPLT
jgi:hypothetical protein